MSFSLIPHSSCNLQLILLVVTLLSTSNWQPASEAWNRSTFKSVSSQKFVWNVGEKERTTYNSKIQFGLSVKKLRIANHSATILSFLHVFFHCGRRCVETFQLDYCCFWKVLILYNFINKLVKLQNLLNGKTIDIFAETVRISQKLGQTNSINYNLHCWS